MRVSASASVCICIYVYAYYIECATIEIFWLYDFQDISFDFFLCGSCLYIEHTFLRRTQLLHVLFHVAPAVRTQLKLLLLHVWFVFHVQMGRIRIHGKLLLFCISTIYTICCCSHNICNVAKNQIQFIERKTASCATYALDRNSDVNRFHWHESIRDPGHYSTNLISLLSRLLAPTHTHTSTSSSNAFSCTLCLLFASHQNTENKKKSAQHQSQCRTNGFTSPVATEMGRNEGEQKRT